MGSQRGLEHLDKVWKAKEVWSTWIEYGSRRGLEHLDRVWKAKVVWSTWIEYGKPKRFGALG